MSKCHSVTVDKIYISKLHQYEFQVNKMIKVFRRFPSQNKRKRVLEFKILEGRVATSSIPVYEIII
jgi:hypothetical protein